MMKRQLCTIAILLGFHFVLDVTNAQAQHSAQLRAHIPFDFIVGDKTLPAGDYIVNHNSTADTLVFRHRQENKETILIITATEAKRNAGAALVFHQYGANYFLAQVQNPDCQLDVAQSRRERELHQRTAHHPSKETTAREQLKTIIIPLAVPRMSEPRRGE